MQDLSERLDRLEGQNRWLKHGLCGILMLTAVVMIAGAVATDSGDATFGAIVAKRFVITDVDGTERLVLELDAGEPTLTMMNHDGQRQVYLGIDENWNDSAYLSICSRLENGAVEKQAVLVATPTRSKEETGFRQTLLPGNTQLLLYDLAPKQESAVGRHLLRLSSGQLDQLKPYIEIREVEDGESRQLDFDLLTAGPTEKGQRFLLDTTPASTIVSGVE